MKLSCSKVGPRSTCVLRWGAEGFYYLVVGVILFYAVWRFWVLYEGFGDVEAVFDGSEEAWLLLGLSAVALAPTLFVGSFAMIWRAGLVSLTTGLFLYFALGEFMAEYFHLSCVVIAAMAPLTLIANGLVLSRLRSVVTLDADRGVLTCRRFHLIGADVRKESVTEETTVLFERVYQQVHTMGDDGRGPTRTNVHGKLGIALGQHEVIPLGTGGSRVLRDRGRVMADFLGLPFREDTARGNDESEII